MKKDGGLFQMQFNRLMTRKESQIACFICIAFVSISFLERCISVWGDDQSRVFSASCGWIGNVGAVAPGGQVMQVFYLFALCMIAALPFSDSFLEDRKNHSLATVLARSTWGTYWCTGLFLSFFGGFCVIFVPLLISQLLAFFVFPVTGGLMTSQTGIGSWEISTVLSQGYTLPSLTMNNPYVSNLVYIFYSSIFAGCNAAIAYLLSLQGVHKKLFVLAFPTIFWLVYDLGISFVGGRFVYEIYLYPNDSVRKEPWFFFVLPLSLILIILAGCLLVQRRKKEAVLL